jgi:hypothetical protein
MINLEYEKGLPTTLQHYFYAGHWLGINDHVCHISCDSTNGTYLYKHPVVYRSEKKEIDGNQKWFGGA